MAHHTIPWVIDGCLVPLESAHQGLPSIEVGSEAWYIWLTEPTTHSFSFRSPQGNLTAHRERSHGNWYWYAYRSRGGHLHKTYLGKSKELTLERLQEAVNLLSPEKAIPPQSPPSLRFAHLPVATAPSSGTALRPLQLLTTKMALPLTRSNLVLRPRLMHQMNAAIRGPLTLIAAPAGWGKTTLLHTWYADANRSAWPFAWVSLDAGDNDPVRFWSYAIAALNTLHPGVGEAPLALLHASPPSPIEAVLTSLLNALNQLSMQTVLVLDDYHLIEAQPIHDALT